MTLWLIRGGRNGEYELEMDKRSQIITRWGKLGDITGIRRTGDLRSIYIRYNGNEREMRMQIRLKEIWDFFRNIDKGDLVVLPCRGEPPARTREMRVGRVEGDYEYYQGESRGAASDAKHRRTVTWLGTIPRAGFPDDAFKGTNMRLTVAKIKRETEDWVKSRPGISA